MHNQAAPNLQHHIRSTYDRFRAPIQIISDFRSDHISPPPLTRVEQVLHLAAQVRHALRQLLDDTLVL